VKKEYIYALFHLQDFYTNRFVMKKIMILILAAFLLASCGSVPRTPWQPPKHKPAGK